MIPVVLAIALPHDCREHHFQMPQNMSLDAWFQTLDWSSLIGDRDWQSLGLGCWGKRVAPQYVPQIDDRIELYADVTADPKQARFERVKKKRS